MSPLISFILTRSHAPLGNALPEAPLPTRLPARRRDEAVELAREAELPQTRPQAELGNE